MEEKIIIGLDFLLFLVLFYVFVVFYLLLIGRFKTMENENVNTTETPVLHCSKEAADFIVDPDRALEKAGTLFGDCFPGEEVKTEEVKK